MTIVEKGKHLSYAGCGLPVAVTGERPNGKSQLHLGSMKMMSKAKLNLVIDGLLLLNAAAIAGIGLLVEYVLVPGSRQWEIYGRNVDLRFWSLDRHEWGAVHYVLGLVFLVLLVLHVVLHWGVIISIYRKLIPNRLARRVVAAMLVVLAVLLMAFSVFVKPEIQERGKGLGRGDGHEARIQQAR